MAALTHPFRALDPRDREDQLLAYRDYLQERNGPLHGEGAFSRREDTLSELSQSPVRFQGRLDPQHFRNLYEDFRVVPELTPAMLLALSFVKLNASEAYGVRVTAGVRFARQSEAPDLLESIQDSVKQEEEVHTRLLVGAARNFDLEVEGAFEPSLPLRILIHALAYAPDALFHPILLASEMMGIYIFNWTLGQIRQVIPDQPLLAEQLERRLIEVLIDELGHVAYNRMALGPLGLRAAQLMLPWVTRSVPVMTPELGVLGMRGSVLRGVEHFKLEQLPQEVLRRGFYV